jgi:uncharacterized membrane protein
MTRMVRSKGAADRVTNEEADKEDVKRVAAFSDAVFAIAMTLLVLDLDIPDPGEIATTAELRHELAQWSAYGAFVLSFVVIAAYWVAHVRVFRWLKRITGGVLWLNLAMLLGVCFLPFATSVLQRFSDEQVAVSLYAAVLAAIGFVWAGLVAMTLRDPLLMERSEERDPLRIMWRCLVPPTVFAVSLVIARFDTDWASYSWIAIFPLMVLGAQGRREKAS